MIVDFFNEFIELLEKIVFDNFVFSEYRYVMLLGVCIGFFSFFLWFVGLGKEEKIKRIDSFLDCFFNIRFFYFDF